MDFLFHLKSHLNSLTPPFPEFLKLKECNQEVKIKDEFFEDKVVLYKMEVLDIKNVRLLPMFSNEADQI